MSKILIGARPRLSDRGWMSSVRGASSSPGTTRWSLARRRHDSWVRGRGSVDIEVSNPTESLPSRRYQHGPTGPRTFGR